jgi:hypothetical protein
MPTVYKLPGGAIQANTITTSQLQTTVVTQIQAGGGPKITNVQIANSTYSILDDTAVDTAGGYIVITGTGFESGASVLIDNTPATSTTFVSSTVLRAQVAAKSAGTYNVYVVNPDGGVGIKIIGLTYSAAPIWVTSSTLANAVNVTAFSTNLSATDAVNYELASGSSLPPNTTLNIVSSNAVFAGNVSIANNTQYTFTVNAIDAQNQDSPRTFSFYVIRSNFNIDSYAANLFLAVSFTEYKNNITGGAMVDLSPQIRTSQGLTAGSAKTWAQNGNPAISATQKAFGQYTNSLGFTAVPSSTSHVLYGAYKVATNVVRTIEFWIYKPASDTSSGRTFFATNAIGSGGYYNAWSTGFNYPSNNFVNYFANPGGHTNAGSLTGDAWNHVAMVFNGTGSSYKLFINGTRVLSTSYQTNDPPTNTFAVGGTNWDGFSGLPSGYYMQDLRIYNAAKYDNSFTVTAGNPDLGGSILS